MPSRRPRMRTQQNGSPRVGLGSFSAALKSASWRQGGGPIPSRCVRAPPSTPCTDLLTPPSRGYHLLDAGGGTAVPAGSRWHALHLPYIMIHLLAVLFMRHRHLHRASEEGHN